MARVLLVVPDLMFGSRLLAGLGQAGHEVTLVATVAAAGAAGGADVVVTDLASGDIDAAGLIAALGPGRPPVLASYAHVEPAAKQAAQAAGIELVVPRSRLHREGAELVAGLLEK